MPFSELQEGGSPSEVATAQAEVTKLLATVEEEQAKRFALPKAAQAQCLQVHNPPPLPPGVVGASMRHSVHGRLASLDLAATGMLALVNESANGRLEVVGVHVGRCFMRMCCLSSKGHASGG